MSRRKQPEPYSFDPIEVERRIRERDEFVSDPLKRGNAPLCHLDKLGVKKCSNDNDNDTRDDKC